MGTKNISLFIAVAIAGFLCAFLISYNSPENHKSSSVKFKSNKPYYQPQKFSEITSSQRDALFSEVSDKKTRSVKKHIKGLIQGEITLIDWCLGTVFIGDRSFNMGSIDMTGLETGDRVEVIYRETNKGRVLESINVIRQRR
ncbi:MAG: hypothetical protein ACPL1G_00050 [Thermodesulfovibrionales bacterium]